MGLSRMLKINTPFIKFLYVKLVSGHRVHLLELLDAKIPMGTYCPLVKANYKLLKGHNDPFTKNVTQYSYNGI